MPFEWNISARDRTVEVLGRSPIDLASILRTIEACSQHPDFAPDFTVIVDLHAVHDFLPVLDEIQSISDLLGKMKDQYQGLILLITAPGDLFRLSELSCAYAAAQSVSMHVFQSRAEAQSWLGPAGSASRAG